MSETSSVCLSCHTGVDATNGKSSGLKEPVDPNLPMAQSTSETKQYDQPADGNGQNEVDDANEAKQEQKHKAHQSQEHEKDKEKTAPVQLQHKQEALPEQEEVQHECETWSDTEQVETFFGTMSHRYENATQEGHIL